jgi:hypothetical protein
METKAFAGSAVPALFAAAILLGACSGLSHEEGKVATLAEITKACTGKKPGDKVTVGGKDVVCQTPTHEVAEACMNRTPGENVRIGGGQEQTCPPACCYINGCNYPQNRKCFDSSF